MCRRCATTVAGGAIGREALDAGMVASGAAIKPGEALFGDLNASEVLRLLQGRSSAVAHVYEPVEQDQQTPRRIPRQRVMSLGKALDCGGDPGRGSRAVPGCLPEAGRIHAGNDVSRERFDRKVGSRSLSE
jgi:hypothetical protein